MNRPCSSRISFALNCALGVMIFCCCFTVNAANARGEELTETRLTQLAADAIRSGSFEVTIPKNFWNGKVLEVRDAEVYVTFDEQNDPYVHLLVQQMQNNLRRDDLLHYTQTKQIMKPFFDKMDGLVGKEIAVVQDQSLNADNRANELGKLDDQIGSAYQDGLNAVAKSIGATSFEFNHGAARRRPISLHWSPRRAEIDMLRSSIVSFLKNAGQPEADFPWVHYKAGDVATAELLGTYSFRIDFGGRQATFKRNITKDTQQVKLPNP